MDKFARFFDIIFYLSFKRNAGRETGRGIDWPLRLGINRTIRA